ncbi:alpha/beta fold hydrolase [Xenorhabdus bovienii]|uniref:alpha/beta fold hydrolase n=1 Tax=Xenorhabdus bovienii TaxID=40576 RepID=UPI00237C7F0F|nr:alpha/beta fold hydrolase [Xenorhabdus bovienii]MDE1493468.1 alpha/beta fold hydrolase [Xenorhabdus bovienii]
MQSKKHMYQLVRNAVAAETQLPLASLDDNAAFDDYGIESVMSVAIVRRLEDTLGDLSKSLLFEFPSIKTLADYLSEEFAEKLAAEPQPATPTVAITVAPQPKAEETTPVGGIVPPILMALMPPDEPAVAAAPDAASLAHDDDDIAIIGLAGRFPQADDVEAFWENLLAGRDCITTVPEHLWDWRDYWDERKGVNGKSYLKWGGFLSDNRTFDPLFFGISKLEAEGMDPQERVFLETVHHTFEDAGYNREKLKEYRVGLYVGIMWGQYQLYGAMDASAGASYASIANRASYFFDLRGPSIALDTMCSGSMTSVHLACESLWRGESHMAIAGGVNLTTHPNKYFVLSKTGFASPQGRCKPFSEEGDGYVPSEGVGALLLKPLRLAEQEGDRIYGVIKASSINHGGKVNGFTVPNAQSQESLITYALRQGRINPTDISYVEAHAAGTALGDPIEVRGLTSAWGQYTDDKQFCAIGSVKSNVGHMESAASFGSIVKVLKQFQHKTLVPSIHLEQVNTNIQFEKTPFYLQTEVSPWRSQLLAGREGQREKPRMAAINAFGAGGANAHLILEEYAASMEEYVEPAERVFIYSARTPAALQALLQSHLAFVRQLMVPPNSKPVSMGVLACLSALTDISTELLGDDDRLDTLLKVEEARQQFIQQLYQHFNRLITADVLQRCHTVSDIVTVIAQQLHPECVFMPQDEARKLASIAWTLQRGRNAMAHRIGIVADSLENLVQRLEQALSGKEDPAIAIGHVRDTRVTVVRNAQDREFIRTLLQQNKLSRVAQLWCQGENVDWLSSYTQRPELTALPLYPFAREICWAEQAHPSTSVLSTAPATSSSLLAALNLSDSVGHVGVNFHVEIPPVLKPQKLNWLLGKMLESGALLGDAYSLRLQHVNRTVLEQQQGTLRLALEPEKDGNMRLACYAKHNVPLALATLTASPLIPADRLTLDVKKFLNGKSTEFSLYTCQTSSVDGIYQHVISTIAERSGLNAQDDLSGPIFNQIHCLRPLEKTGSIILRQREERLAEVYVFNDQHQLTLWGSAGDEIMSEAENVESLLYRPSYQPIEIAGSPQRMLPTATRLVVYPAGCTFPLKIYLAEAGLTDCYFIAYSTGQSTQLLSDQEWLLDADSPTDIPLCLQHISGLDEVFFWGAGLLHSSGVKAVSARQELALLHQLTQATRENNTVLRIFTQLAESVQPGEEAVPNSGALSGYFRSLVREYPKAELSLLDGDWSDHSPAFSQLYTRLYVNGSWPENHELFLRGDRFLQREIVPVETLSAATKEQFRQGGVYLIIGGVGVVGQQISRYLAECYGATLVWFGRSQPEALHQQAIADINALGGHCYYYCVGVQDSVALAAGIASAEAEHGMFHGVFHLAMTRQILRINQLDNDTLRQQTAAKLDGSDYLAALFKSRQLDFLLLFSSAEGWVGSAGWSTYAAGCAYQNQAVSYWRSQGVPAHTISWGFWEGVEENLVAMLQNKGIRFITPARGIEIIRRVLSHDLPNVIAVDAKPEVLRQMGFSVTHEEEVTTQVVVQPDPPSEAPAKPIMDEDGKIPEPLTLVDSLVTLFADVLKLNVEEIDPAEDMLNYGVDSLIVLNIQTELENRAGSVGVGLLLENQTINDIAQVMLRDYPQESARLMHATPQTEDHSVKITPEVASVQEEIPLNGALWLRKMPLSEGSRFLIQYGEHYQSKTLRDVQPVTIDNSEPINEMLLHGVVNTGEGEIEVFSCGQGAPVVLMPAVALTAATWLPLLQSNLRHKYQFIILHPPGYGISTPIAESNMAGTARSMFAALTQLGIDRPFHLVGSCLGCAASLLMAKNEPQRIASLTLVGGFHDTSDLNVSDPATMGAAEFEALASSAVATLRADFQAIIDALGEGEQEAVQRIEQRRDLLLNSQHVNFLVALRYLNEMMSVSLLPWLPEIHVPTHCVFGDLDVIINPRHSHDFSQGIQDARLTCIPGSAHFPYLTHDTQFTPVLEAFVDEHEQQWAVAETGREVSDATA